MNIKPEMISEIAAQIKAVVRTDAYCPRCGAPLLEKLDQDIAFCWLCTTDRIAAQRARNTLSKLRMAVKGIIIDENWIAKIEVPDPAVEGQGCLQFGMPL